MILVDVNDAAVRKGIDGVNERLARLVSKGALQHIKGTVSYDDLRPAGIVIEAVNEDLHVVFVDNQTRLHHITSGPVGRTTLFQSRSTHVRG